MGSVLEVGCVFWLCIGLACSEYGQGWIYGSWCHSTVIWQSDTSCWEDCGWRWFQFVGRIVRREQSETWRAQCSILFYFVVPTWFKSVLLKTTSTGFAQNVTLTAAQSHHRKERDYCGLQLHHDRVLSAMRDSAMQTKAGWCDLVSRVRFHQEIRVRTELST